MRKVDVIIKKGKARKMKNTSIEISKCKHMYMYFVCKGSTILCFSEYLII